MSTLDQTPAQTGRPDGGTPYEQIQATPDFQHLKRTLRRFVFPATVAFLAWYLLYIALSAYGRGFMSTQLLGTINVAYVFGLLQFVSTFGIAWLYARYADTHFDPTADRLRAEFEGAGR